MAKLTERFIRTAPPGKHYDDHGLFLNVKESSARHWVQRTTIRGKRCDLGLGSYPLVSLAEAREAAFDNRRISRRGGDPRTKRGADVPSFAEALDAVIAIHRAGWKDAGKSEDQWRSSLRTYAEPLAAMPVSDIEPLHILAVLTPHWHTRHVTMQRVRTRIGAVMAWAIAQGHRKDDPVAAINAALPKPANGAKAHHQALAHGEVAGAVAKIRASDAGVLVKLALELVALTATRSGEVRFARWEEIDLDSREWRIPAARTKRSRDHRVPLSDRAIGILTEAAALADGSGLVFPPSRRAKAMSSAMFSDLLKDLGIACVPHGFRASFRDWCSETDVPHDVAEAALAHEVRGRTERAYLRTDQFDRRRVLMQDWAAYISTIEKGHPQNSGDGLDWPRRS